MKRGGYAGGKMARGALETGHKHLQPDPQFGEDYAKTWRSIVEDFDPKHFRECDRPTLHNYCVLTQHLRSLERRLVEEGPIVEGLHGPKENPVLSSVDKLSRTLLAHARSLKIVPSSRLQGSQIPKDSEHRRKEQERAEKDAQPDTGLSLVM